MGIDNDDINNVTDYKEEIELLNNKNIDDNVSNDNTGMKLKNLEILRSEQIAENIYLFMKEKAEEICKEKLKKMKEEADEAMLRVKQLNDEKILADKLAKDKAEAYKKLLI